MLQEQYRLQRGMLTLETLQLIHSMRKLWVYSCRLSIGWLAAFISATYIKRSMFLLTQHRNLSSMIRLVSLLTKKGTEHHNVSSPLLLVFCLQKRNTCVWGVWWNIQSPVVFPFITEVNQAIQCKFLTVETRNWYKHHNPTIKQVTTQNIIFFNWT